MAQLPGGDWFMQEIGGLIVLFHQHTGEEIVKYDPSDANASAQALKVIYDSNLLNDEQKCLSHYWAGYFLASAVLY